MNTQLINNQHPLLRRIFLALTAAPKTSLLLGLMLVVVTLAGLPRLQKDTSISAFIPDDHESLVTNNAVKETFGLADAVAIAVVTSNGSDVFTPDVLLLIDDLSLALGEIDNLRDDRVASIATESSIRGDAGAVSVDQYLPYFSGEPGAWEDEDVAAAGTALTRLRGMPAHQGSLISYDESAAIVMAEMIDESLALPTFKAAEALVGGLQQRADSLGVELLLAGPGAVSGYFSAYINKDVRVLLPLGFAFVLLFVYLAFLRVKVLLAPLFIIVGAAGGALGIMGWMGVDYFAITNSLPVILVAIAVADAIHVLSCYFIHKQQHPTASARELAVASMCDMARPVVLTSITTMAGFIGLGWVSIMPPISYFAWFATLGVGLACFYTLVVLPGLLVLLNPAASPAFRNWQSRKGDWLGKGLLAISQFSRRNPVVVLSAFAIVSAVALASVGNLRIDRSQVENFRADEPLRLADERINTLFAGTGFLNVMVTSDTPEGLLGSAQMQAVAQLQAAFDELPNVRKTISIVDYLSVLHAALNEQPISRDRQLPMEEDAIAQYLLVYEASGSPDDFAEEISSDYSSALIRGFMNVHRFSDSRATVEALQTYLRDHQAKFSQLGLTARIAGDVNITYHWMTRLIDSHFAGIGLALLLVLLMASLMFRSLPQGLLAVLPVVTTVLAIYGVMVLLDIHLDPPSSMFAAIAIGVGVDFSIHLLDRMRRARVDAPDDFAAVLALAVPETARACLFNALALAVGFSVMMFSLLPTLQRFGGFIALAAAMSFVTALLLIPAVVGLVARRGRFDAHRAPQIRAGVTGLLVVILLPGVTQVEASELDSLDALAVAQHVANRPEGDASSRHIAMELTNKRGKLRTREALVIKRQDDAKRFTRITYLAPKSVREVAFLSHDQLQPGGKDDRWLYLPATRKVRRVPASDRGDYFLGTDFTFEDMQSELKFALEDYDFELLEAPATAQDKPRKYQLRGVPKTKKISQQLGYGAFEAQIDSSNWMPTQIQFFDLKQKPLKRVQVGDVQLIDGVWNAGSIECSNSRTGHTTRFLFSETRYLTELPQRLFQPTALSRGMPEL